MSIFLHDSGARPAGPHAPHLTGRPPTRRADPRRQRQRQKSPRQILQPWRRRPLRTQGPPPARRTCQAASRTAPAPPPRANCPRAPATPPRAMPSPPRQACPSASNRSRKTCANSWSRVACCLTRARNGGLFSATKFVVGQTRQRGSGRREGPRKESYRRRCRCLYPRRWCQL